MTNKIITENESKELNPRIEKMVEADIETVMKIESKSFDFPWKKKKNFMKYAERGDAFVVRTTHNVIVGYILIKRKGETIVIYKMATDPEYRCKGFGGFIIDWAQKFTKDQSATRLLLRVRASNYQAIEFYKNKGFEEIRKIEGYYENTGSNTEEKAAIKMQWVCS